MAVDPEDIHEISIALVQMYRDVELRLIALLQSYLVRGIDSPTWLTERLAAVNALQRAAGDLLGQLEVDASVAVREYVARAYRTGYGRAVTELPEPVLAALAANARTVVPRLGPLESLAAAFIQDVGARHSNVLRHVIDVYRATIGQASALSIGGGLTRRQASQDAFARFISQGVGSFTDAGGRTWRLSSYVEMGVRTVTQRAAVQGQTDRQEELGLDLVVISNSPRECPRCRPWEGKVLALRGPTGRVQVESVTTGRMVTVDVAGTLEDARRAGLFHPNCTHSARAYLPGATKLPRGDLSNEDGYKAKDRQRAIERQIRGWKEREAGALEPEAKAAAGARVRAWQAEMRKHLADHPELKRLPYREQVGAGNRPPATLRGDTPTGLRLPAPARDLVAQQQRRIEMQVREQRRAQRVALEQEARRQRREQEAQARAEARRQREAERIARRERQRRERAERAAQRRAEIERRRQERRGQ